MDICKKGAQEASDLQNEVITAVKKHAEALRTAMDDKTDASVLYYYMNLLIAADEL